MMSRRRRQNGSVRKRGRKTAYWEGIYREDVFDADGRTVVRKHRFVFLGYVSELPTKTAAHKKLDEILGEVNSPDYEPRSLITLQAFFDSVYVPLVLKRRKPSTQRDVKNSLRRHILTEFGHRPMTEITKLEMQAHFAGLLDKGPGWYTVMKIKNYLSAVFSRAIELDCGIKLNPVSPIDLGAAPGHSDPVNLTDEQIAVIEEGLTDPVVKTLWWLTSVIGCRKGEARALRLGSIDWEHGKLWIKESRFEGQTVSPKTAKGKRAVDLSPAQLTRLAEYCRLFPKATAEDFLFPSRQRRTKAPRCMKTVMNQVIKPVARKLGIQKVGWQMLRRWNSTVMNEESFSDKVRQVRLGHASPIVTNDSYTYVRDSVSRRAGEALDDRLEKARKKNSSESVGTPEEVCV